MCALLNLSESKQIFSIHISKDMPPGQTMDRNTAACSEPERRIGSSRKGTWAFENAAGNLEPGKVYPDYPAPIVHEVDGRRTLARARWGMPSSKKALLDATSKRADKLRAKGNEVDDAAFRELMRLESDISTTNIRNVASTHWRPWLGMEHRCVVPATYFSEYGQVRGPEGKLALHWFATARDAPLYVFAGIWMRWTSVRKAREGDVTIDIFAFLTTEPNAVVVPIHPKAMPVILTEADEIET